MLRQKRPSPFPDESSTHKRHKSVGTGWSSKIYDTIRHTLGLKAAHESQVGGGWLPEERLDFVQREHPAPSTTKQLPFNLVNPAFAQPHKHSRHLLSPLPRLPPRSTVSTTPFPSAAAPFRAPPPPEPTTTSRFLQPSQPAANTFSQYRDASEYKWDRAQALAAGQPPPARDRYRKKKPMGATKHKENVQSRSDALMSELKQEDAAFASAGAPARTTERSAPRANVRPEQLAEQAENGQLGLDAYRAQLEVAKALDASPSLLLSRHSSSKTGKPKRQHKVDIATALRDARKSLNEPEPARPPLETYEKIIQSLNEVDKEVTPAGSRRRRFPTRLTRPEQDEVEEILREKGVIASLPGAEVAAKDIRKLLGLTWLNDEVITFYAMLINRRSKAVWDGEDDEEKREFLRAWSFTSFFYSKYTAAASTGGGYPGVRRWTKKVDIFAIDLVIVPINQNGTHWVCAAINMRLKRFEYYDSLGGRNPRVYATLRQYVTDEHLDKKKKPIDLEDWEDYWNEELPQQSNSSDCGIFTCQFMESLSRGVEDFDFTQDEMPYLRNKMILEIKRRQFIREPWATD